MTHRTERLEELLDRTEPHGIRDRLRLIRLRRAVNLAPLDPAQLRPTYVPGRVPDCARCVDKCCKEPHRVRLRLADVARLLDAGLEHAMESGSDGTWLRQNRGRCLFLGDDERCQVYEMRPLSCQAFPYQVSQDRETLRFSKECKSFVEGEPESSRELAKLAIEAYGSLQHDSIARALHGAELEKLGLLGPFEVKPDVSFAETLRRKREGS